MRHPEFFQMVYTCLFSLGRSGARLRECQKFAFVGNTRRGMQAHVAMVHLIQYHVCEVAHLRSLVVLPVLWSSLFKIYYRGTPAVDAYSFCPYAGSFVMPFAVLEDLEGIEFAVELARY